MLREIIKTLSDTELVAIATESNDVPIRDIFEQLQSKNDGDELLPFSRIELSHAIINELANRLLERDSKVI